MNSGVSSITNWFKGLDGITQKIIIFGTVLATLIPSLAAIAAGLKALGISAAILSGPIAMITGAIIGLTVAIAALIEYWDDSGSIAREASEEYLELNKQIEDAEGNTDELNKATKKLEDTLKKMPKPMRAVLDQYKKANKSLKEQAQLVGEISRLQNVSEEQRLLAINRRVVQLIGREEELRSRLQRMGRLVGVTDEQTEAMKRRASTLKAEIANTRKLIKLNSDLSRSQKASIDELNQKSKVRVITSGKQEKTENKIKSAQEQQLDKLSKQLQLVRGLGDLLNSIAEKNLPAILSSFSGIVMLLGDIKVEAGKLTDNLGELMDGLELKMMGMALAAASVFAAIFTSVASFMDDLEAEREAKTLKEENERRERNRKAEEERRKLEELYIERLEFENLTHEIGNELIDSRIELINAEIDAEKKLNDILIDNNLQRTKTNLELEKQRRSKLLQAGPELGFGQLETGKQVKKAQNIQAQRQHEANIINDILTLLKEMPTGGTGEEISARWAAINKIKELNSEIKLNTGAKSQIGNILDSLGESTKMVLSLGGLYGGKSESQIRADREASAKEAQQGGASGLANILSDLTTQIDKGTEVLESSTNILGLQKQVKQLTGEEEIERLEDIIEDKDRNLEQLEKKPGTETEQQLQTKSAIEAILESAKFKSTFNELLTEAGQNKLIKALNRAEPGFEKTKLELLKSQLDALMQIEESNKEISDNTSLETQDDRLLSVIDIASGRIKSAGINIPTIGSTALPSEIAATNNLLSVQRNIQGKTPTELLGSMDNTLKQILNLMTILVDLQDGDQNIFGNIDNIVDQAVIDNNSRRVAKLAS
jgi:uncharacterized protein YjbJ (UPF0337 family)